MRDDEFNCLSRYSDARPEDCPELRFMIATGAELEGAFTPEGVGIFLKTLAMPENFFKHADRDPTAELEFNREYTTIMLVQCGVLHREITGRSHRECSLFLTWLALKDPQVLLPGEMLDTVNQARAQLHDQRIALDMDRHKRLFLDTAKAMNLWNDAPGSDQQLEGLGKK